MSMNKDYYALLGVSPDADRATIEEAYERLAKEVQPNVNLEPTNPERMRELDEAFDVLDDPAQRAEYDRARSGETGAETSPPAWAASDAVADGEGAPEAMADGATTMPDELGATTTTTTTTVKPSLKKGPDSGLIAGIALLVGGVAALAAGIVVLVLALTNDDGGVSGQVTTDSGLRYTDTVVGSGEAAVSNQVATVHYTGRLEDGTQFDSSVGKEPFAFIIDAGQVIPGWDEGVTGMKEGGKRTLVVPPELAYGADGNGPIPPNATIMFDIELLTISALPAENPPEISGDEQELEGGLKVIDVVEGTGEEAATGDTVFVHYTGWLEADGTRFDTSLITPQALAFTIGQQRVIRGWDAGVPGMKEGGTRRLIIPPELAYAQEGAGDGAIPPNATLIFDIQLVEIEE